MPCRISGQMKGIGQTVLRDVPGAGKSGYDLKLEVHVDQQVKDIVHDGLGCSAADNMGIQVCFLPLDSHDQCAPMSGRGLGLSIRMGQDQRRSESKDKEQVGNASPNGCQAYDKHDCPPYHRVF